MTDPLCTFMGILDIIAGLVIIFAFFSTLATAFGIIMIIKGAMSFF